VEGVAGAGKLVPSEGKSGGLGSESGGIFAFELLPPGTNEKVVLASVSPSPPSPPN